MAALIIVCFVVYVIYYIGKRAASSESNKSFSSNKFDKKNNRTYQRAISRPVPAKLTASKMPDDSIIDVTGNSYSLPSTSTRSTKVSVPYWHHRYVYSVADLQYANTEQKEFYNRFKQSFLQNLFLDLEGNLNYAFILLFDLLNGYDSHRDLPKLEKQIRLLGNLYSKTRSYGLTFLCKKMEDAGDSDGLQRIVKEEKHYYRSTFSEQYWKFGAKYKSKLNLNDEEVKWLNRVSYGPNSFSSIESCMIATMRLYLRILSQLKQVYLNTNTELEKQILSIADIIARKHFKYRVGSDNYKYCGIL